MNVYAMIKYSARNISSSFLPFARNNNVLFFFYQISSHDKLF